MDGWGNMYTYVLGFNLKFRGGAAEEFLSSAVRAWPRLWGEIPGVTGTLLLASAFGLGGEFEYQWRVDFERLSTLARIDEALKSDDPSVRAIVSEWFEARTAIRSWVARHLDGSDSYDLDTGGRDGAIHLVLQSVPGGPERTTSVLESARSAAGVLAAQVQRTELGTAAKDQVWLRLRGLESLDDVADLDLGAGHGQLFGEIRELDGSLFTGA
jgi:hypothetical protein